MIDGLVDQQQEEETAVMVESAFRGFFNQDLLRTEANNEENSYARDAIAGGLTTNQIIQPHNVLSPEKIRFEIKEDIL